jgi:hypothetical protein
MERKKGTQLCDVSQTQQAVHTTHTAGQTAFIFSTCAAMHGLHENGMQTATVTDMGGSENPGALCSSTWHTEWAQNQSHFFKGTINSYSFTVNSNTVLYRINRK